MLDVLGMRAPFVGMGVDAQLLEDNEAIGRVVDRMPGVRRVVGGGMRYALSVALRSVPRFATAARPNVVAQQRARRKERHVVGIVATARIFGVRATVGSPSSSRSPTCSVLMIPGSERAVRLRGRVRHHDSEGHR